MPNTNKTSNRRLTEPRQIIVSKPLPPLKDIQNNTIRPKINFVSSISKPEKRLNTTQQSTTSLRSSTIVHESQKPYLANGKRVYRLLNKRGSIETVPSERERPVTKNIARKQRHTEITNREVSKIYGTAVPEVHTTNANFRMIRRSVDLTVPNTKVLSPQNKAALMRGNAAQN